MAFCLFWYEFNTGCFPPESGDWEEQVSNRMMVAVYVLCRVVRQEGVIGCFLWLPMRENLRGFSQRLMRFYLKKKVSIPCLEDAVLQPPVLQDSSGKERVWGGLTPQCIVAHLNHSTETLFLTPSRDQPFSKLPYCEQWREGLLFKFPTSLSFSGPSSLSFTGPATSCLCAP